MCATPSLWLLGLAVLLLLCEGLSSKSTRFGRFAYPHARRDNSVVDNYHGTLVHDPYRWLENPDSAETKAFINAENAICERFINTCPLKAQIRDKLTKGANFERYESPFKGGDYYYFFHNKGLENHNVMYVQTSLDAGAAREVFLDPNKMWPDGTRSLSSPSAFSRDGSLYVYSISMDGADVVTLKVRRAPSGQDLPDTVTGVKFSSILWTKNNQGFFYSAYPRTSGNANARANENHSIYYHRLGTDQTEDILVFNTPQHPGWMLSGEESDDGNYAILTMQSSYMKERLYVVDMTPFNNGVIGRMKPIPVVADTDDYYYTYVTNDGPQFVFLTSNGAPSLRVVRININRPSSDNWVTLVGQKPKRGALKEVVCVNGKLVLHYLTRAKSRLFVHNLATGATEHRVSLELGTVSKMKGRRTDTELFFKFETFVKPASIYRLDMTKSTYPVTVYREVRVPGFSPENFVTRQVYYSSTNGTRVTMFIVHKKNLRKTGNHPVWLHGYGGFKKTLSPRYSTGVNVFLEHLGGIYALPNLRGGSLYGERWSEAGKLANKQNTFDDFQAAAQYLIDRRYTNTRKIVITGGSNGGLLVAACLNQRPDLFAAGIPDVGVLDMYRFHKFTIGHFWMSEYGNPDNATEFQWLRRYSPLHNIPERPRGGQYPATLLLTSEQDDRVVPMHTLKFTAQLQYTLGNKRNQVNPLLLYVEKNAGHAAGRPISKLILETTRKLAFMYNVLGLSWTDSSAIF